MSFEKALQNQQHEPFQIFHFFSSFPPPYNTTVSRHTSENILSGEIHIQELFVALIFQIPSFSPSLWLSTLVFCYMGDLYLLNITTPLYSKNR